MYVRRQNGLAESLMRENLGAWATRSLPTAINGRLYAFESTHRGSTTAVYVPDTARATDPVNLLVWIHGDLICGGEGETAVTYVKSKTFPFAKQLADSGRPFVLVVPSMRWKGGSSHDLGQPGTMNAFLEEVRRGLTGAGWSTTPRFGRLILAGHSRGYAVLNTLARRVNDNEFSRGALATLTDIWLFDTTYGKKHKEFNCATWTAWAKTKSGVNVRILYREVSDTAPVAECIRDAARRSGLTNITVTPFKPRALTHCAMPANQLPNLLAPNGQPVTSAPIATERSNGSLAQQIQKDMARAQDAVKVAVLAGNRDQNELTNRLFFARHPERKARKLLPAEPEFKQLSAEWVQIRNTIVRPLIASTARQSSTKSSPPVSTGPYPEVNTPMPPNGPGFDRQKAATRSFGLPETISALIGIAAAWHQRHPDGPRIGIRDVSRAGGGKLSPHKSHQVGLDVDILLENGKASWYTKEGPKINDRYKWVLNSRYSRTLTAELIRLILEHPKGGLKLKFILFDDPEMQSVSTKVVKDTHSPHRDHLHVRFCAPDYFLAKVDKKFKSCT